MRLAATTMVIFLAASIAPAALAAPPTNPDEADETCQDLGKSGDASISAQDRIWFSETCTCRDDIGCGLAGSPRWMKRAEAARQKDVKRIAELQQAEQKASAEQARKGKAACAAYATCLHGSAGKPDVCEAQETAFEYECSATIRDVETCDKAVDAMRAAADKAECIETFR